MANTTSPLLPSTEALLAGFGERLRLARLRRRLQAKQVAERAGMTEVTLRRVERGLPGVTMGAYLAVMQVLQLHTEVEKWATDDPLGRHLQDSQIEGGMRPRRARRTLVRTVSPMATSGSVGTTLSAPLGDEGSGPGGVSAADLRALLKRPRKSGPENQ